MSINAIERDNEGGESAIAVAAPLHQESESSKIFSQAFVVPAETTEGEFDTTKVRGKLLTLAAAAAALTAGVLAPATSASAATPQPKEWGMVVIKLPSSSSAAPMTAATTVDVGGGTWTYGYDFTSGGKRCYSNYFHGSKFHHATAKIANNQVADYQPAGTTARADATAGAAYTCYAYWGLDE